MFVPAGDEYECLNNVSKPRDQMSKVEECVCVTWATWSGCAGTAMDTVRFAPLTSACVRATSMRDRVKWSTLSALLITHEIRWSASITRLSGRSNLSLPKIPNMPSRPAMNSATASTESGARRTKAAGSRRSRKSCADFDDEVAHAYGRMRHGCEVLGKLSPDRRGFDAQVDPEVDKARVAAQHAIEKRGDRAAAVKPPVVQVEAGVKELSLVRRRVKVSLEAEVSLDKLSA
eukprot:scaffold3651_cov61-Phaeocystis_antarctica.AAC.6